MEIDDADVKKEDEEKIDLTKTVKRGLG